MAASGCAGKSALLAEIDMASFFHMGGYGFYVWGSYGVLAAAVIIELAMLRSRRKAALTQLDHASQEDDS